MKTEDCIKLDLKYKYKQTYRKIWEEIPEFKGWLRPAPNKQPNKAFCCYCNKLLHAHRISLLKHTCTAVHQRATQQILHDPGRSENNTAAQLEMVSKVRKITAEILMDSEETEKDFHEIEDGENQTYYVEYDTNPESDVRDLEEKQLDPSEEINTKEFTMIDEPTSLEMSSSTLPSPVTTHVLDTSIGRPVANLMITFAKYDNNSNSWNVIAENRTDDNGRLGSLIQKSSFTEGCYRFQFHVNEYFEKNGINSFYPLIEIVFNVANTSEHYHVPLLLSPYGYSTYRGS